MVQLAEAEIGTREVLDWRGVHLLHFPMSSCSQKTRIVLNLKDVEWTGHVVDIAAHESYGARFLGINPRGLVPVLVVDGAVHVESNDIIELIDRRFAGPDLFPDGLRAELRSALAAEDALHHDLRHLSFRFVHGRTGSTKSDAQLEAYGRTGATTVGGQPDAAKASELAFYRRLASEGLSDALCRASALRFAACFSAFDTRLADAPYLLGKRLSALDVAWFVYAYRLRLGGYPLAELHPRVARWFEGLAARPAFAREVEPAPALAERIAANVRGQRAAGRSLREVAGL